MLTDNGGFNLHSQNALRALRNSCVDGEMHHRYHYLRIYTIVYLVVNALLYGALWINKNVFMKKHEYVFLKRLTPYCCLTQLLPFVVTLPPQMFSVAS